MKAVIVIDMPDNLDIPLEDIKADITVSSKDVRKSMLYLKYKNVELKPLPPKLDANDCHRMFSGRFSERELKGYGWNACLYAIVVEAE